MRHNLLTDPIIRVTTIEGRSTSLSLPGLLASLAAGDSIDGFAGLRPHQAPAWYTFLVQLAALASLDGGDDGRGASEEEWRARLRALTAGEGGDAPWHLAVEDLSRPAFLQPPVPEGSLAGFQGPIDGPDADPGLDVLVTGRDHDLKFGAIGAPLPDHWVYALVTLQTQAGFSGRSNYGVVRMNSGYGSRPVVGFAPDRSWAGRFRRDLDLLLREHDQLARAHERPVRGGTALLWLQPWDGNDSWPLRQCDPYVIEVARRVRLVADPAGRMAAFRKGTAAPRIAPKSDVMKGNVGDPWIPVKIEDGAALTVGPRGFDYDRLRCLLFEDGYAAGPCQQLQPDDPEEVYLYAAALARGQGGTDGFHERWLPIPRRARFRLAGAAERESLAELARDRVELAAQVEKSALRPALLALLQAGDEKLDFQDGRHVRWGEEWSRRLDVAFFPQLWEDLDLPRTEQDARWAAFLRSCALEVFEQAWAEAPVADVRRERARARAEALLLSGLRKLLPSPPVSEEEGDDH
ncbi:MAG TPA: type I-E CRISPR-associated protein Cse1/CasA [Dehalococcoidia bacterium]